MRVLLVTPPMIQLNTPYPATAYLAGFLRLHAAELGITVTQADTSIALFLRLFSAPLVTRMARELRERARTLRRTAKMPPSIAHFLAHAERYADTVESVIRFLQRRDPTLAFRIISRAWLPEGPRFAQTHHEQIQSAFGHLGTTEQARYLASLYVDDLADVWRDGIDPRFELAKYGERLASSVPTFDPLQDALTGEPTLVDESLDDITRERYTPHVIEPSAGADRATLAFLCEAYHEDVVPDADGKPRERVYLKFHPRLAPIKAAVFPLVKKDGMPEIAQRIYRQLKPHMTVFYDEKGAVGRRYARQDEAGTPFCITVDGQTLQDDTVTIRERA